MQFEIKVGTDYSTVKFQGFTKLGNKAYETLISTFEKLGLQVEVLINQKRIYKFPSFITSEVIQEIIHNTCFVCGGLMKDEQAIQEGKMFVSSYDNAVDTYEGQIEYPNPNQSKIIKVRKCSSCGHSHT